MDKIKNPILRTGAEYILITLSIWIMVIGIYFFKFPNHFAFGGITGFSSVISSLTGWTASSFTSVANISLLFIGFLFLGRDFGFKTVYATLVMSGSLAVLEWLFPLDMPLTDQPILELVFAIFLPAIGTAILFNIDASSGGTDIIAMVLKKYTRLNVGTALMVVDILSVAASFFIFDIETGLFSLIGLAAKSLVIDDVIENLNLCKCFNIVCDDPTPICDYIINTLHRSATIYHAEGAFSHHDKTVILSTMKRSQALKLRSYIKSVDPTAFMLISNSSEIVGKGFLAS